MKKYKKDVTRICSLFSVKIWYEGESKELEKWIGVGFFNHIFVSRNGVVTLYYDVGECNRFYELLEKVLDEDFFNELCDYFCGLIEQKDNANSNEEIFNLAIKAWPALTIFDEISKDPEWANDFMLRRLMRLRISTESFSYELEGKARRDNSPKNYVFFQGKVYLDNFDNFCKEKGIEIIE